MTSITDSDYWKAVARIGVPSAIALFLVWRLASQYEMFDKRLEAIATQQAQIIGDSSRTADALNQVLNTLRAMCVNDAKNADARRQCLYGLQ